MVQIETRFTELLKNKERELKKKIELEALANEIEIDVDILRAFESSHISDVSNISIGSFIKVAQYFNTDLNGFIACNSHNALNHTDGIKSNKTNSPARVLTGNEFKKVFKQSKYFDEYNNVPTLLDELAKKIDGSNGRIIAGVVNNLNLKIIDENVLIRFFCSKGKIFIKSNLFGKSIGLDKKGIYKKIYSEFFALVGKETIDNAEDVSLLMRLVDKYVEGEI